MMPLFLAGLSSDLSSDRMIDGRGGVRDVPELILIQESRGVSGGESDGNGDGGDNGGGDNGGGRGDGGDDGGGQTTDRSPLGGNRDTRGGDRPSAGRGGAGSNSTVVIAPGGSPEVLMAGSAAQIDRAIPILESFGGRVLRRSAYRGLGFTMIATDPGLGFSIDQLGEELADGGVSVSLGLNYLYSQSDGGRHYAASMIGLDEANGCRLTRPVRVGLIDGPVDPGQLGDEQISIVSKSVLPPDLTPGSTDHATGIVELIASRGQEGVSGLAVGARIYAATAFGVETKGDRARSDSIVEAFEWLIAQKADLVSMPFAGPRNEVFSMVLASAAARGMTMVAPVGNDRTTEVGFPASDPNVIAVTAVDARKRLYARANRGPETAFAAPGVDLYLPGADGFSYRSGTSYATAVVTALIAQDISRGVSGQAAITRGLIERSEDLGPPGRDPSFGWGLVRSAGCK